jgi:hypothetical protein
MMSSPRVIAAAHDGDLRARDETVVLRVAILIAPQRDLFVLKLLRRGVARAIAIACTGDRVSQGGGLAGGVAGSARLKLAGDGRVVDARDPRPRRRPVRGFRFVGGGSVWSEARWRS